MFVLVHLLIDTLRALTAFQATKGLRRSSSVESRVWMTLVMGMSVTNGLLALGRAEQASSWSAPPQTPPKSHSKRLM